MIWAHLVNRRPLLGVRHCLQPLLYTSTPYVGWYQTGTTDV
jgi:hypothetical protein